MAAALQSHPGTCLLVAFLIGFILLNVLGYRHAHAMTHFVRGVQRTAKPEELSLAAKLKALFWGVRIGRPVTHTTPAAVGLPYEKLLIDGDRGRLAAWYIPHLAQRGLVLLLHGYARCKADLLPEARAFHELGYSCLLVDFPGCGDSDGENTTIGFHEAMDVVRCVEMARQRWPGRRLIVFGQSMGSSAVLRAMAVHGLAVDAAVLECPFDRLLSTVKARFRAMGLPGTPAAHLLLMWGAVQNGFNPFAHKPVEYARRVTCPVLMMHGSADPRVTSGHFAELFASLTSPKRMHVFNGVGHESYVVQRPFTWKETVSGFLAAHRSNGRHAA
jgi:alpha-beta hydrolase superfamily lysophospholipase